MKKNLQRIFLVTLHPFLFATFPILSLYAKNFWETPNSEIFSNILFPIFVLFALIGIFLFLSRYLFKSYQKPGILASLSIFLFFSFGHFASILIKNPPTMDSKIISPTYWILFVFWILLYGLLTWFLIRSRKSNYPKSTQILNAIGLILIIFPLLTLGNQIIFKKGQPNSLDLQKTNLPKFSTVENSNGQRDIYYLIFDRYGNTENLKEFYDFDNSDFLENLRKLGFHTAERSTSNYPKTANSLSSSLNMRYLSWLTKIMGPNSPDWRPMYMLLLKNPEIFKFLKSQGYQIIQFGSYWPPTAKNSNADFSFTYLYQPMFKEILFKKSFLMPISIILKQKGISLFNKPSKAYANWLRVPWVFDRLAEIPEREEPTFTFMHMLCPHPPHVFNIDGSYAAPKNDSVEEEFSKEGYVRQVAYLNKKILKLVEQLQKKSKLQPIIIIQSDEGEFPIEYARSPKKFDWTKATKAQLRKKMGILNALYLPNLKEKGVLHQDMTPINTFRIILRNYFNVPIPLLPETNFIFKDENHIYDFYDITQKLKTP